jgi:hypothetical protein
MLALAALHVGDASAAKEEWYRCYIEGHGWMWCLNVG